MTPRTTLIFPVSPQDPILFRAVNGEISVFTTPAQTGAIYDLIIPGQFVRIYAHELPKMREREKMAAARFAVEDRTGASLDGQHIVIGSNGDTRLAVIETATLSEIISQLTAKGLEIGDIYADYDWAAPQDAPIVLEDRIIFAASEGYTIDPDWADAQLQQAPKSHWDSVQTHDGKLSLRQGEFARRSALDLPVKSLAKIAALLAVAGLSWLTLEATQSRAMMAQTQDLKTQTAELYTQVTGQAAPANPAVVVTRAIKSAPQTNEDFLPLLAGLNAALLQTNNIAVQSLSYDESKAALTLRLIYPNFEGAGQLEQAVARTGGVFRPGGVREQNGILIGDATFELGTR